jgi:hypothetical protein
MDGWVDPAIGKSSKAASPHPDLLSICQRRPTKEAHRRAFYPLDGLQVLARSTTTSRSGAALRSAVSQELPSSGVRASRGPSICWSTGRRSWPAGLAGWSRWPGAEQQVGVPVATLIASDVVGQPVAGNVVGVPQVDHPGVGQPGGVPAVTGIPEQFIHPKWHRPAGGQGAGPRQRRDSSAFCSMTTSGTRRHATAWSKPGAGFLRQAGSGIW